MVLMKGDDLEEKMFLYKRWGLIIKYMVIGIGIIHINIFSS